MNKLELIETLRDEGQISKKEAAAVVDLFFNEIANNACRERVTGLKSVDCVLFMSRNTKRMPGGILKLGNRPR